MKRLFVLAAAALAGLAGCASPAGVAQPEVSFAPADLVLQVRSSGGFVPVELTVTALPELSVYGDGRVITTGPVPAIYPGPALPNVQVQHIARADVQALARRARQAGVGGGADLGIPSVADAPSTRITVRTAEGVAVTDAPALGIGDGTGLTDAQRAARRRLEDLVTALRDLPKTLGDGAIDRPVAYEPALIAAVARPWAPASDGLPADPPPIAWPGPALPGPAVPDRPGVACLTAEAAPVLSAAKGANSRTPWTSGDQRWAVEFRPLLPGESSCADLTAR
ncbi:hypothetical protein [Dactylosporangium sp. CA-092794]|uniref:hypothetical protein n=1 Tax=Dactylosporangium sp. CA-092794 TaxID=3239929 RepID=UPI003D94FE1C